MTGNGSVSISRMLNIDQCFLRDALNLGIHQQLHHLLEGDGWRPAGRGTQLDAVADKGRSGLANDGRLDFDVLSPIHADAGEGDGRELLDAVGLAGGNDEVVGGLQSEDANHRVNVVGSKAPVHAGGKVAEDELVAPAARDFNGGAHNLGREKFSSPECGLVIVEKARRRSNAVVGAVHAAQPDTGGLGDAIDAAWTKRRALVLDAGRRLAEAMRGGGVKQAAPGRVLADRLQHVEQAADMNVVAADVELQVIGEGLVLSRVVVGGEVENCIGRKRADEVADRKRFEDVDGRLECKARAAAAGDAVALDADDRAALAFQAFQQQPAVLPCAADDDCAIHVNSRTTLFVRASLLRCRLPAMERSTFRRGARTPARARPGFLENARGGPESSPDWPPWHRPRKRWESR